MQQAQISKLRLKQLFAQFLFLIRNYSKTYCSRCLCSSICLLSTACSTSTVEDFYSEEEIIIAVDHWQLQQTRLQTQAESTSLREKAAHFEKLLYQNMHHKIKLIPKVYMAGKPGPLRLDMSALLLATLACKYHVLKDPADKQLINSLVDNIISADAANGYDGFLPYKVRIVKGHLEVVTNETHANVYAQLFFAYYNVIYFVKDKGISEKIRRHLRLIIWHFVSHNFVLYDQRGKEAKYSDLSPSRWAVLHNRQLSLLSLLDFALFALDKGEDHFLLQEISATRTRVIDMGYGLAIQNLHYSFLGIELPTHSSSWLNFLKMYTGSSSSKDPIYAQAYHSLNRHYDDEQNPFFQLIGLYITPQGNLEEKLACIRKTLATFPLDLNRQTVINSRDENIIQVQGNYVKLQRIMEASTALPMYRRALNSYEWKRNQKRLDGNFMSSGNIRFSGIDYLQVYWMLRAFEKNNKK